MRNLADHLDPDIIPVHWAPHGTWAAAGSATTTQSEGSVGNPANPGLELQSAA